MLLSFLACAGWGFVSQRGSPLIGTLASSLARYRDGVTGREYWAKVAFKARVHPRSYKVSRQTVRPGEPHGQPIDRHFDNSELEWSTRERGAVILYGLLVRLEEGTSAS